MSKKSPAPKSKKSATSGSGATAVPPPPDAHSRPEPFPRMFGDWFERWPEAFARRWPESFSGIPFVEAGFRMEHLVEEDGTVVVRGELPGLDPDEDVTITIEDDRLVIKGTREERSNVSSKGTFHSEFHYGAFHRSVPLPAGTKPDDVTASYTGGILEVRVPVEEGDKPVTKISVVSND